jgi:hypothetical protein
MISRKFLASTLACALALGVGAAMAAPAHIALAPGGELLLPTPDGWVAAQDPDAKLPSLRIRPATGKDFEMEVTPVLDADGSTGVLDPAKLRPFVEDQARSIKTRAVEQDLPVVELKSPTVVGYYFSATDRTPAPGEFTQVTQGVIAVGNVPVTFTILYNGKGGPVLAAALTMLRGTHKVASK